MTILIIVMCNQAIYIRELSSIRQGSDFKLILTKVFDVTTRKRIGLVMKGFFESFTINIQKVGLSESLVSWELFGNFRDLTRRTGSTSNRIDFPRVRGSSKQYHDGRFHQSPGYEFRKALPLKLCIYN